MGSPLTRKPTNKQSLAGVVFCVLLMAGLVTGCGQDNELNRQKVTGSIKLDGAPLATGTIEFAPQSPKGVASGATITAGEFVVPATKGLPPGEYLVRISSANEEAEPVGMPGESNKIAPELIPEEYNSESKTTFTVKEGEENHFELSIESANKKS